jgi:hypothetical protein
MATYGMAGPMGPMGPPGQIDRSLVEYTDILFNLMGIDITYERFQKMSDNERKQFVRNIKLNNIING